MKLQIYSSEDFNKNFEYNNRQTEPGSTLRTYKGSRIARSSKYGVGKEIGGEIYFHKNYAEDIIPSTILKSAVKALEETYPDFEYNCMKYNPSKYRISFQEAPDFDTAREPIVGEYVIVEYHPSGSVVLKRDHSNYIWHHKWNWVRNDYPGFDVEKSWNWSKEWLNTLLEPSDGNGIGRWNNQLDKYGLPHDR